MKTVKLTLIKNGADIFFNSLPIKDNNGNAISIGPDECLAAMDLWDMLDLPVSQEYVEVEVIIAIRNPKPNLVDIFNLTEEVKFQHYRKLDDLYDSGEYIAKEKIARDGVPGLTIKCASYGVITDMASIDRYFRLKGKEKAEVSE